MTTAARWPFTKQVTKQALTAADLMEKIAKEESWLEHYTNIGVAAPKTEENIAALREQLRQLRGQK